MNGTVTEPPNPVTTTDIIDPVSGLVMFTCPWAEDGLARAVQGMGRAATGVTEYHIGSRGLHYVAPGQQIGSVGWWAMWRAYCCPGSQPLPTALTGQNASCRIISRDV